jgi:hypothetical protein
MGELALVVLFLQLPGDLAVLSTPKAQQDLPCRVTPARAVLGFDLGLHAGYTVRIPRENVPAGRLSLLVRLIPVGGDPVYLKDRVDVPPTNDDLVLQGRFAVREGRYNVDWLLRDQRERVCSAHWKISAAAPRGVELAAPLDEEAPVAREGSLHLRVLLPLAPPYVIEDLVRMLRAITREPRFGRLSLVAFRPAERRIVFRQDDTSRLDFRGLRDALGRADFVQVDYQSLLAKKDVLSGLLAEGPYDAVLVLGSTLVYYPRRKSYSVSRPVDFAAAWRDIRGRLPTLPIGRR